LKIMSSRLECGQGCLSIRRRTRRRRRNPTKTIRFPSLKWRNNLFMLYIYINLDKHFVLIYKCLSSRLYEFFISLWGQIAQTIENTIISENFPKSDRKILISTCIHVPKSCIYCSTVLVHVI